MSNPAAKSWKWRTLVASLIVLIALGGWFAWRADWSAYHGTSGLLQRLAADPLSKTASESHAELSRRLRAGRLTDAEIAQLADLAMDAYSHLQPSSAGLAWPAASLRELDGFGWLPRQHKHRYFTTLLERDLRLGLSSEGISATNRSRLIVRFPRSSALLATVSVIPEMPQLEPDQPVYWVGLGATNLHAFCLLSFADDLPGIPQRVNLSADLVLQGEFGTSLWEGVARFENISWPPRGLPIVDTPLARPTRMEPRAPHEDGPG